MDNQNHDPINNEAVESAEVADVTSEPIINQEVEPAKEFSFMDSLDVDYRNEPSISKFKSANDMAKSYMNLSKMLGKEKAVIPTDLTDGEAIAEYMSKIGRPEDVKGYELNYDADNLGRELDLDSFKQVALDNNMTKDQAQGLISWYADNVKSSMVQESEKRQEAIAQASVELRKEFGAAYDEKMSKANSFFKNNFSSIADNTELVESLGNNPQFIKDIAKLAGKFSEASIGDTPKQVTLTPKEAEQERVKLMNSDAYRNVTNPEHSAAVEKARELLRLQMS